ncbi:glycoside hydrolase family 2 protein, partial [Saccharibacillus sp. O23]|uniref:glycoside hydrolase family 2 protein n=1 Tax=Saccharibacillus sp. O23 TaxID=2009338 RepID=UPI00117ADF9D
MTGRKSQAETSGMPGRLCSDRAADAVRHADSKKETLEANPDRERISLNGQWDFMPLYDRPQELSLPPTVVYEKRKVNVPSSWRGAYESRPGYTFGRIEEYDYGLFAPYDYPRGWDLAEAGLLRRNFEVPQEWTGRRIVLRLDGVMQQAAVYLNGIKLAIWRDGYLPLRLDATPYVRPGETCELQVVCANFDKTAIPSGAVKVTGLTGSWFGYLARGLWQDVWLESYPQTTIETVAVRTSVREGRLEIDASIGTGAGHAPIGKLTASLKVRRVGGSGEAPVLAAETAVLRGGSGSDSAADDPDPAEQRRQAASDERAATTGGASSEPGGSGNLPTPAGPTASAESARSRDAPADEPRESDEPHTQICREPGHRSIAESPFANNESDTAESGTILRLCENDALPPLGRASFLVRWTDAELWSPDSPVLYEAELELAEDGVVVDRRTERFGFREFWNEGPEFVLNGVPIRLRGDSWHFQGPTQQTEDYVRTWYAMCREVGVNCIRLHAEPYPEYFLKIADETGMLLVGETAIYGSGKSMAADHPDYVLNALEHVRRLVLRDRNRPSVVMWSVENEMRWVDGRDEFKRHIPVLIDAMKQLDPTRPIVAEGDNRLLPRESTEVESRHYNIDGTIAQWDRRVPLTFGEHGSWWYICPQNASMYVGFGAYRHTDESARGLAEKERLFVEYARRQGVSGISTFNFAHYFMRAMPERDIPLEWDEQESPGVKPDYIPAYSLTLNNGLLPPEYPAYRPNPAFAIMAEAFRPAALIAAEYDRAFFDDGEIRRTFDVHNDTLTARDVAIEFAVSQGGRELRRETVRFRQEPAERRIAEFRWMPERAKWTNGKADRGGGKSPTRAANEVREDSETRRNASERAQPEVEAANCFKNPNVDSAQGMPAESVSASVEETAGPSEVRSLETSERATLTAVLYHDGQPVHELTKLYRVFSADLRSEPIEVDGPCFYIGRDDDYGLLSALVPDCSRTTAKELDRLPAEALLIVGSFARDEDGRLERGAKAHAARGGRLLVLEQDVFSIGRLTLSRRDFIRAHAGSYDHPIFAGLGDEDLMFWDPELREEGPSPIAAAAFEKPAAGDYRLLLESSAGDFGDGGDLWTPLLEYRGGGGYLLANQLGLTSRFARVPQACLLLRRLLAHAGRADVVAPAGARSALAAPLGGAGGSAAKARFLGGRGGMAERLLTALRLPFEPLRRGRDLSALAARLFAARGPAEDARPSGARNAPDDLSAADSSAETA